PRGGGGGVGGGGRCGTPGGTPGSSCSSPPLECDPRPPSRFLVVVPIPVGADWLERLDPARADKARGIPPLVEAGDRHSLAGLARMDEATGTDVDPVVAKAIEEDDVARPETFPRHPRAEGVLLGGIVGKLDAD